MSRLVAIVLALAAGAQAADPAGSWLSYAQYAAEGGKRITTLSTTWKVPANPAVNFGSNAPGWWFGLQTSDGAGALIQPILAWGYKGNEWDIFNGVYDWNKGAKSWTTSDSCTVQPGDLVTSSVTLAPGTSTYTMAISTEACGNILMDKVVDNNSGLNESVAYFVLEHQPITCKAYPADGAMSFENIYMEVEFEPVEPEWEAEIGVNACNSECVVKDSKTLEFTWDTAASSKYSLDHSFVERTAPVACAKDVAAATTDLKTASAGIQSAISTCASADTMESCLTDIDTISEAVATAAGDINVALVDCGAVPEETTCSDTVVDVIGDFAHLTEAVAAAAIHCQDSSSVAAVKQCIDDVKNSKDMLKGCVAGVEQAVTDCGSA